MTRWNIYRAVPGRLFVGQRFLGVVEAPHHPAAVLAAWEKWPNERDPKQQSDGFVARVHPEDNPFNPANHNHEQHR